MRDRNLFWMSSGIAIGQLTRLISCFCFEKKKKKRNLMQPSSHQCIKQIKRSDFHQFFCSYNWIILLRPLFMQSCGFLIGQLVSPTAYLENILLVVSILGEGTHKLSMTKTKALAWTVCRWVVDEWPMNEQWPQEVQRFLVFFLVLQHKLPPNCHFNIIPVFTFWQRLHMMNDTMSVRVSQSISLWRQWGKLQSSSIVVGFLCCVTTLKTVTVHHIQISRA